MFSDHNSPNLTHSTPPTCYFSIVPSSDHFSVETPSTSPLAAYSAESFSDPAHPLLAYRSLQSLPSASSKSPVMDASKFLQMQTQAAHTITRPPVQPMTYRTSSSSTGSNSSSSSDSGSYSPSMEPEVCCSRCRRSSITQNNMVKFGTNLYYCSHCAGMVGFSHG